MRRGRRRAIVDCSARASEALETPVNEARTWVQDAPIKHADETSWRQGNRRAWLWTVVTRTVTVFAIHAHRTTEAARSILGRTWGILCSDRYVGYGYWPARMRQVCWAHLIRDFTAIRERGGTSEPIGKALLKEADRLFVGWHRVRDGTLQRSTFQNHVRTIKQRVRELLEQGLLALEPKTAGTCEQVLKCFVSLWTFANVVGVEPTNNAAERAVRHPVLYRKVSFGTHSEWGSRFVGRILTVHATCKQQARSVLEFVHQACEARRTGSAPPSLLPSADCGASSDSPPFASAKAA